MKIREMLKKLRRKLTFFVPIKEPPKWVWKAYDRWKEKIATHPYDMVKHFVGKHYIYKVTHGTGCQGEAPITGWYKKRRVK